MLVWNGAFDGSFAFAHMGAPITRLNFWGVRGSTPTVDPATWRYGGNTPCLELEAPDGTQFILAFSGNASSAAELTLFITGDTLSRPRDVVKMTPEHIAALTTEEQW